MIKYLLSLLIGFTGGKIVAGARVGVIVAAVVSFIIAATIAKGIEHRKENNIEEYLNINEFENAVNASSQLKDEMKKYLHEEEVVLKVEKL